MGHTANIRLCGPYGFCHNYPTAQWLYFWMLKFDWNKTFTYHTTIFLFFYFFPTIKNDKNRGFFFARSLWALVYDSCSSNQKTCASIPQQVPVRLLRPQTLSPEFSFLLNISLLLLSTKWKISLLSAPTVLNVATEKGLPFDASDSARGKE